MLAGGREVGGRERGRGRGGDREVWREGGGGQEGGRKEVGRREVGMENKRTVSYV